MAWRVEITQGGEVSAPVVDFTSQIPIYDIGEGESTPQLKMGMQFDNGGASMSTLLIDDDTGEMHRADGTKGLRAHNVVKYIENVGGTDYWLGVGWIAPKEIGRNPNYFMPAARQFAVTVEDANAFLRGLILTADVSRPTETGRARLAWVASTYLNGSPRVDTVVTFNATHLAPNADTVSMPATKYEAGTYISEIIADCATTEGKEWGIVIHHTGGSHLCFQYILPLDHTTNLSALKISDDPADHDLTSTTAPVVPPAWDQGAATLEDGQELATALVFRYGNEGKFVYVEDTSLIGKYNYYADTFYDDRSITSTHATNKANTLLDQTKKEITTHQPTIRLHRNQIHLINAGMSVRIKSAAALGGEHLGNYQTRRVGECIFEPASGPVNAPEWYTVYLRLDRPRRLPRNHGKAAPSATTPKPAPSYTPSGSDTLEKFYNALDAGGDAINWTGILDNQTPGGANGTTYYHYKSNSPNTYQNTWAYAAGNQLRVSGYIGCRSKGYLSLVFTNLPAGTGGGTIAPSNILSGPHILTPAPLAHTHTPNEWTLFSAGPFTAPTGTTSVALGRASNTIDFDEVSVYTVAVATDNPSSAVDYDGFPHAESEHFLPSDYVEARLDDLQEQVADAIEQERIGQSTLQKVLTNERFPVWGHRGDIGSADSLPENTLESVRQCALKGIQGAEIDVRLSSEGTFYLMHDSTVDRTTSGTGAIASKTDAQIDALTIDGGYGYISGSYSVPSLASVFDALNPYDFVLSIQLNVSSDANATALAQFVMDNGWAHRSLIEVSTLSEAAAIKAVSSSLTVQVNNTVSGADADDNVDWLSMERATITSLSVVTGKAPQHVKSYITIDDFPADETTIIQNMWDRGVAAYQTDNVDFAIEARNALLYSDGSAADLAAHLADTTDAHDASSVSIVDAGAYYTGTDVEAALQEIGADLASVGSGTGTDHAHIVDEVFSGDGSTVTFDLANSADPESAIAYVSGTRTQVTVGGTINDQITFAAAPASGTNNISVDYVAPVS